MENTKKITLTEALSKLKLLNKKIEKKDKSISEFSFIDYRIGKSKKGEISQKTEEEIKQEGEKFFQSYITLVENRDLLKSRIAQANASTKVKFNDKEYTIVELIELKNQLPSKKMTLTRLQNQYTTTMAQYRYAIDKSREKVQSLLSERLGTDSKNQNADEIEKLANSLAELNKATLIDPLNLKKIIEDLEQDIDLIENELDTKLSIINARTEIEVPETV